MLGDLITGVPPCRRRTTLLLEAALLLAAACFDRSIIVPLLLASAMGMHNSLVLRAEGTGVALTYVTGTLVQFGRAAASRLAGRETRQKLWPYLGLWLALLVGAASGGIMSGLSKSAALIAVAGVIIALAAAIADHDGDGEPS